MIKFFQKLKAKKGFTLVELIVVIAIIGVLAAILIPTMLGYVTQSRVTSVNSTAASIKNNIDTFLTNCDTAGYGMLKGTGSLATFTIDITNGGTWTITITDVGGSSFKSSTVKNWSGSGSGSKAQAKGGVTNVEDLMMIELADLFPEIKSGTVGGGMQGGKCTCVWYTGDTETATSETQVSALVTGSGWQGGQNTCAWDGTTAGVSTDGFIVGTAPVLAIG